MTMRCRDTISMPCGIPNAEGTLIDGADHKLIWTHTRQLADLIGT